MVGTGLALCGTVMQAALQNPLADPFVLGISSGASLGATFALLVGFGAAGALGGAGGFGVPFWAFLGAAALVLGAGSVGSRTSPVRLILAGTAVNALCGAASSALVYFANSAEGIRSVTFWTTGSLASAAWDSVYKGVRPHSGTVTLGELDVLASRPAAVFTELAVVAQFNELGFDFTVAEMVAMGRTPHKRLLETTGPRDRAIVAEELRRVRMDGHADRSCQSLSGGEKQRVVLARALAQEPGILILDEPTNHLDIKYQLQILSLVGQLGVGVLAALHDLTMAARYCDELYVLKDGSVVTHGPPEEILTPGLVREVYEVECETYRNPVTGELALAYLDGTRRPRPPQASEGLSDTEFPREESASGNVPCGDLPCGDLPREERP